MSAHLGLLVFVSACKGLLFFCMYSKGDTTPTKKKKREKKDTQKTREREREERERERKRRLFGSLL